MSEDSSPVIAPAAASDDGPGLISRGERGPVGDSGERGPTGDAGRDGRQGLRGVAGVAGIPADLVRTVRNAQRIWVLFGIVVALFLAMAGVLQHQAGALRSQQLEIARTAYDSCLARDANVARLNATFDALAQIEQTNPYTNGAITTRRISVYSGAKFVLVDCGVKP